MEFNGGMSSTTAGITITEAEASSYYHVVLRISEAVAAGEPIWSLTVDASVGVGWSGGSGEKKKRGRPGNYARTVLNAQGSGGKRGRGHCGGNNAKRKMGLESFGDANSTVGTNFLPHVVTVNAGEDITMKIISLSQQGPRAICILPANGVISHVTLRQSDSCGHIEPFLVSKLEDLTLEIISTISGQAGSGGMSISLASPDGRIVGGSVAGLLVAGSPVQVVVGSFLLGNHLERKPRKQKIDFARAIYPSVTAGSDHTNAGEDASDEHHMQKPDNSGLNHDLPPTFMGENWVSLHNLQDSLEKLLYRPLSPRHP